MFQEHTTLVKESIRASGDTAEVFVSLELANGGVSLVNVRVGDEQLRFKALWQLEELVELAQAVITKFNNRRRDETA